MGERSAYDEIDALRERLRKLEARSFQERQQDNRARVASLGLAVGATAVFLSPALPWLRDTGPHGLRISDEGEISLDALGSATGWELWGAALDAERWGLLLGFLVLAFAFLTAVWAVFALGSDEAAVGNRVLLTAQIAAAVPPVLFLFFWTYAPEDDGPAAGPGVFAAVAACVLIILAARRGKDL
ncbi:hypothetical protein [Nocardiopsis sp. CC223A]|uniref:hypothetical protein n=1 Tax=Nocardiopsis sp. CC223A TaxID=3044051 RepID=UPI00278C6C24|nr:hypothetical protein [Nocardiopsis sp. CC223A]